MKHIILSTSDL